MHCHPRRFFHIQSSILIPGGNFQSKRCSKFARASSLNGMAKFIPGHPLLPTPNGINTKLFPFKSIELFKNLSGRNSNGMFPVLRVCCYRLCIKSTLVPEGISYSPTLQSSVVSLGTSNGAGG